MAETMKKDLFSAINDGDFGAAIDAVEGGAGVNEFSPDGFSPLMVAAYRGHRDIAEYLIGMGADVNLPNDVGALPMHYAAVGGSLPVAEILFLNGAQLDAPVYEDLAWTELHFASFSGNEDVFEFLVGCGSNHKIKDAQGYLPQEVASGGAKAIGMEKEISAMLPGV